MKISLERRDTSSICVAVRGPRTTSITWAAARGTVGELLATTCRTGLSRTERLVKERMTLFDVNTEGMTPQKPDQSEGALRVMPRFLRRKPALAGSWTRPTARRVDAQASSLALGPGGLSRDRAGSKSATCIPPTTEHLPIETRKGPNIGSDFVDVVLLAHQRFDSSRALSQSHQRQVSDRSINLTADQEEIISCPSQRADR